MNYPFKIDRLKFSKSKTAFEKDNNLGLPSFSSFCLYNAIHIGLFIIAGIASFLFFLLLGPITNLIRDSFLFDFVFPNYVKMHYPNTLEKIIVGIFIAPIVEELIFRNPLRPTAKSIAVSISLLSYFLLQGNIARLKMEWILDPQLYVNLLFSFSLFFLAYKFLSKYGDKAIKVLESNKFEMLLISSIIFGLFHITGSLQDLTWFLLIFSPVYQLTHIASGVFYAYVFLKHGLLISIASHILFNALIILLTIL